MSDARLNPNPLATPATSPSTTSLFTSSLAAPAWSLHKDTGADPRDGITSNGKVIIDRLDTGDTWTYSIDSGRTWLPGIGNSLLLGLGSHPAGSVQFQRTSASGLRSAISSIDVPVVVDTLAMGLTLSMDKSRLTGGITRSNGLFHISGLESGARWEYSIDSGKTWNTGQGTSFKLPTPERRDAGYLAESIQVRQIDLAGNTSPITKNLTAFRVAAPPAELSLSLLQDTGASAKDGVTSNGRMKVSGLETGARWTYSIDGGQSWQVGNGSLLVLSPRAYEAGQVQVKQVSALGIESRVTRHGALHIDTGAEALSLQMDKAVTQGDIVRSNGVFHITGLETGARWEYSVNGGKTWTAGTATSFKVPTDDRVETHYLRDAIQVRQTDLAGNVAAVTRHGQAFQVVPPTPALTLNLQQDTGAGERDGITANGTLQLGGLPAGARWQFSTDGGKTWQTGTGTSLLLPEGSFGAGTVQVRAINAVDEAGPVSTWASDLVIDSRVAALTLSMVRGQRVDGGLLGDGAFQIDGLEPGARWEYSIDGGRTWQAGSATGFSVRTADGVTTAHAAETIQVRQVDPAGNTSTVTAYPEGFSVIPAPRAPSLTLRQDTGSDAHDGRSRDGTVDVGALEPGASWSYSTDGGKTWQTGTGQSFVLSKGQHPAGSILVQQFNAVGEASPVTTHASALQIDLGVNLAVDTGESASDGITHHTLLKVDGLVDGQAWQYSLDGGRTWQAGSGTDISLPTSRRNLLTNSDFKAGGTGWTSDFGSATVSTNFPGRAQSMTVPVRSGQEGGADPGFYVLQLDPGNTRRDAWATTIDLVDGGDHVLSGYVTYGSSTSPQTCRYTIHVDGVQVGEARTASVQGGWQSFNQTLSGLSAGRHTVSIRAVRPDVNATYTLFGLDSLQLQTAGNHAVYTPQGVQVRQSLPDGEVLTGNLSSRVELDVYAPTAAQLTLVSHADSAATRIEVGRLEAGIRQELSIDGGPWEPLDHRSSVMPQAGKHRYNVRQRDLAGQESISDTITVDAPELTRAQIKALPANWMPSFSVRQLTETLADGTEVISLLGTAQIAGLDMRQLLAAGVDGQILLAHLSPEQVQGLTSTQIRTLTHDHLSLTVASGKALLSELAAPQILFLTKDQLLSVDDAGRSLYSQLEPAQVRSLGIDQLRWIPGEALTRPDAEGEVLLDLLGSAQLAGLSNAQLISLDEAGTARLEALGHERRMAELRSDLVRDACDSELTAITYTGLLHFFQQVRDGLAARGDGLSAVELDDLRTVVRLVGQQAGGSSYLRDISNSLVNGDKFNTSWTDGGRSLTSMGNLAVGSSAGHLDRLIRTWLLGQNNPIEPAGQERDADPLWGAGGPRVEDVDQGAYNDCTAMSAMAAICAMNPDFLKSLFIDNGNGTYGVRVGGQHYTFDTQFSVKGSSAGQGVIWPRLLEKAWYAYSYDHLTFPTMVYEDIYLNIEPFGGSAMINFGARHKDANNSGDRTVLRIHEGLDTIRNSLKTALENREYVSFGSGSTQGGRISNHQYAVLDYDAATDRVTMYNPWGYRVTHALKDLVVSIGDQFFLVNNPVPAGLPQALSLSLVRDTGHAATDQITTDQVLQVQGLPAGTRWQFSTDAQMSWQEGSGDRLFLREGSYDPHRVVVRTLSADGRVTDMVGNAQALVIDRHALTPMLGMTDTGRSDQDGITASATIRVERLERGASWSYRIDDGSWQDGTGTSLQATEGRHTYEVRQIDAAGNVSATDTIEHWLDTTAPDLAGFRLVSATGRLGVIEVQPTEADARLEVTLDHGRQWQTLTGDSDGRYRIDLPELTSPINQLPGGRFQPGDLRDWRSDYGVNVIVPPSTMGRGTPTGLEAGQEGQGDTALVVRGIDFLNFNRDVWSTTVHVSAGVDYRLSGYLAAAVSSTLFSMDYQVRVDDRPVGTGRIGGLGWQAFGQTLSGLSEGEHKLSIRASMKSGFIDSLFAVDSLSLTSLGDAPRYESGAIQVRNIDLAGNATVSHNLAALDWTRLDANLAVL